ncbi:MAG: Ig-like domain repeat protein [Acidobacteriaceae bacterium]
MLQSASLSAQTARMVLRGNVPSAVQRATDMGAVKPQEQIRHLSLIFERTPAQTTALEQLLAAQQDPTSPSYRYWLTPEQFAAQFGPGTQQIQTVKIWLQQQGFTVEQVARGGGWISFTGTAEQVQQAFQTKLRSYSVQRQLAYANATEPSVPAALAGVVAGVRGLSDITLQPQVMLARRQASSATSQAMLPQEFATQYDLQPLYNSGINGTGVSIAVAGQAEIQTDDVQAFRAATGLPAAQLQIIHADGTTDGSTAVADVAEAETDLEWAGAVARNASLIYVTAPNVLDAAAYAVDQNLAPVLSLSYGACEQSFTTADLAAYQDLFAQANAEGITVVSATGDAGAAACDAGSALATHGLAVDFPASLPYVTAVGGTQLAASAQDGYAPEAAWSSATAMVTAGGGGSSALFQKPTWQQGSGVPADGTRDLPDVSFAAALAQGGYPVCVSGSCSNGLSAADGTSESAGGTSVAAPAFAGIAALLVQKTGTSLGNLNPELYKLASMQPQLFHDVTTGSNAVACTAGTAGCSASGSMGYNATSGYDLATGLGSVDVNALATAWPMSTTLTTTNTGLVASTYVISYGTNVTFTASVTPASGPTGTVTFAAASQGTLGTAALNNGTATLSTSKLLPGLYSVVATYSGDSTYASSNSQASSNVQVTVQTATPTVSASISPATGLKYGNSATLTTTVSGASGGSAPTGTVTANIAGLSGSESGTLFANSNGTSSSVNLLVPAPPPGKYTVNAVYGGDTNFATAAASTSLTTISGDTTTTVTISPNPAIINQTTTLTAVMANAGTTAGTYSFTGTVQFYDGSSALGTPVAVVNNEAFLTTTFTKLGTHSIYAVYSGDTNWNGSTSAIVGLAVTTEPTVTTLTNSYGFNNNSALAGANIIFTAVVGPQSTSTSSTITAAPTGTVTFYDASNGSFTNLGTANLAANGFQSAAATLQTKFFIPGQHVITAVYSGDTNYQQSVQTTAGTVTMTIYDFSVAAAPASPSIAPGQAVSPVVQITSLDGFSGQVSMTCAAPAGTETSCSINPTVISGGTGTAILSISTTAAHAIQGTTTLQAQKQGKPTRWETVGGGTALAGMLLLVVPSRKRKFGSLVMILIAAAVISAGAGCSGKSLTTAAGGNGTSTTPADPGTPQGNQTFTITAVGTDGYTSVTHQLSYQVIVQ